MGRAGGGTAGVGGGADTGARGSGSNTGGGGQIKRWWGSDIGGQYGGGRGRGWRGFGQNTEAVRGRVTTTAKTPTPSTPRPESADTATTTTTTTTTTTNNHAKPAAKLPHHLPRSVSQRREVELVEKGRPVLAVVEEADAHVRLFLQPVADHVYVLGRRHLPLHVSTPQGYTAERKTVVGNIEGSSRVMSQPVSRVRNFSVSHASTDHDLL